MSIVSVTDDLGAIIAPEWVLRAESVHRQLRDKIPPGSDAYQQVLQTVFANGARMALAVGGEAVRGVAVWRIIESIHGRRFYVDDLVVDAACRSQGIGKSLMAWMESKARARSCTLLALDSRVARQGAHRFYFREGFHIPSFCFLKVL